MQVMTENKVVTKLRFGEFQDGWKSILLSEVSTITTGTTPSTSKKEYYDGKRLFVSPADIKDNRFVVTTKTTLTELGFKKGRKLAKGSVLFVCIGSTIGKIAQVYEECMSNQQINALTANSNNSNDFIFSLLSLKAKKIKRLAGVQAVPQLNKTDFSKLKFYFPSLPEQQKIASFLSAVDKKLQQLTKKKELLEEYKKGVMQKIFSQELRFKDANGNNYPHWEDKKLGKICSVIKGKQLNKSELTETGLYPALNGGINASGYTDKWNTEKDVITISEGGNSCGYVNLSKTRFWCGGHCYSLLKLQSNINFEYLFQMLKFSETHIMRLRVGSGLPNIQMKEINKFSIKLPEIDEQQKIANFLSAIDDKISLVSTQIENTKAFKKGLLQQMFV